MTLSVVLTSSIGLSDKVSAMTVLPGAYSTLPLNRISLINSLGHLTGTTSRFLLFISGTSGLWSVMSLNLSCLPDIFGTFHKPTPMLGIPSLFGHTWFLHLTIFLSSTLLASYRPYATGGERSTMWPRNRSSGSAYTLFLVQHETR